MVDYGLAPHTDDDRRIDHNIALDKPMSLPTYSERIHVWNCHVLLLTTLRLLDKGENVIIGRETRSGGEYRVPHCNLRGLRSSLEREGLSLGEERSSQRFFGRKACGAGRH
jgi:hypothetical protein